MGFVSDIVGGLTGATAAEASTESARIQAGATERGIGATEAGREQGLGFLAPFGDVGQQGISQAGFLTDPQAQFDFLQNNPLFKLALESAQTQTQQQAASRGRSSAGDTLQQLSKNVLLSAQPLIAGQKQSITDLLNFGGGIAGSQANVATGTAANITDLITSGGAAEAAGVVGAANARTAGAGNILDSALLAGAAFSDKRLKSNVMKIGAINDHNIYSWTWNSIAYRLFGLTGRDYGVIAQEVKKINPDAVFNDRGFLKVNYSMLGVS